MSRLPLGLLLLLAGCEPWNLHTHGSNEVDDALWDPSVLSATDGVYVRLPHARELLRVASDGTFAAVDLDGAAVDRMVLAPDQETVLAFASWPVCNDDDPKVVYVDECLDKDLSTDSELEIIQDGEVVHALDVPSQYNAFAFNDTGTLAVAYLDFSKGDTIDVNGVLNLTEAIFVDIASGETHAVPVGFAAENVLFSADGNKALVLSRSEVALVALTGDDAWTVRVTYPLTLDVDQEVAPQDAVLIHNDAGDTDYALVSVAGQSELYVLDLTYESIDIVELDGVPSDLYLDEATNQTLIVYGNRPTLDVLEHELFEVESFDLDEPCTKIQGGDGKVVLYDDSGSYHDVYLFDTVTETLTEERAENPIMEMLRTDDGAWGVASMYAEGGAGNDASSFFDAYYGLGVFDLGSDESDPIALVLEGEPVGLELTVDDGKDYALALMDGVDALQKVDLAAADASEILLEEPPLGIDATPDGTFVVTHESPLGLISFVDAATESVTTAAGFASAGLLDRPVLPRRHVEE
jgi:DNA-binding beta-propeller fold protein YncE